MTATVHKIIQTKTHRVTVYDGPLPAKLRQRSRQGYALASLRSDTLCIARQSTERGHEPI